MTHESPRNRGVALTISRPELLSEGSDAQFRKLVHNLFAFFARHESIRNGHAKVIDLAGVEYSVLISVAHLSSIGAVNIATVAEHLHVSGTFVTRIVKSLEKKGLVEKTVSASDRRRVDVCVTELGRSELKRLSEHQRRVNDIQFAPLSASEFEALNDMVARLIDSSENALALQNYLEKAPEEPPG